MRRVVLPIAVALVTWVFSFAPVNSMQTLARKNNGDTVRWVCDPTHSNLLFSVTHMGLADIEGHFKLFNGRMWYTQPDMSDAQIRFVVDVNSIDTDYELRDKHLTSDAFFYTDRYPKMQFKSTAFIPAVNQQNRFKLHGDLTIREVTKAVVFDVVHFGMANDGYGTMKSGFRATTAISRFDFNMKWNTLAENVAVVGDSVRIRCNVELRREKPKTE